MDDTFYFVAFCCKEQDTLTVIDLAHCVDYERSDWAAVNNRNFVCHKEAIAYARHLSSQYKLKYQPFRSRYNSQLNEPYLL